MRWICIGFGKVSFFVFIFQLIFVFYLYFHLFVDCGRRMDRRLQSAGNGEDETETDFSSKTFGCDTAAVVFTGPTISRLS